MRSNFNLRLGSFVLAVLLGSVPIDTAAQPDQAISDAPRYHGLYFGEPLDGIPPEIAKAFRRGMLLFGKSWSIEEGLGPYFNAASCSECHAIPMTGGSGASKNSFVRHSPVPTDPTGGTVRHRFLVDAKLVIHELGPEASDHLRRSPALFGAGLLEAVDPAALEDIADPDDRDGDGISGRVPRLPNGDIGRFGIKSEIANLDQFAAKALHAEIGIASDRSMSARGGQPRGAEVADGQIEDITTFMRFLAAPPDRSPHEETHGAGIFDAIGCADCHVPSLPVTKFPVDGYNGLRVQAYTDLLLHDLGPALADDLGSPVAARGEFRTAPLWGLAFTGPPFLHDGRAATLEQAIAAHGGEASRSSVAFASLTEAQKASLLAFLMKL